MKKFEGSFFEIGRQQGELYKRNGMSFDGVVSDAELYRNQRTVYEKHYPQLLEEFEGIAAAGGWDRDALIYEWITGGLVWYKNRMKIGKGCTIFGVKNKHGVFVGRNYDWYKDIEDLFETYKVINPARNTFIAVTDMGIDGPDNVALRYRRYETDDAVNNRGLYIGLTFAYNNKWSYGLGSAHMIKLIAETCSTVEEALEVFERVPVCVPKNFFIADQSGAMAVVEHAATSHAVVYPKNGVLIQTNHYVDSELAKQDLVLVDQPAHNTFLRYNDTLEKINKKKDVFKLEDVITILGDTGSCVCQNRPHSKTVWSLALDMGRKEYRVYSHLHDVRKEEILRF